MGPNEDTGSALAYFANNFAKLRGGAIYSNCDSIGTGCFEASRKTWGAWMKGFQTMIIFENNSAGYNGTDIATTTSGWVQEFGVLRLEESQVNTILGFDGTNDTIEFAPGTFAGNVEIEYALVPFDGSVPPGLLVASKKITFKVNLAALKDITFGFQTFPPGQLRR
jgi:predicted outer membrane repeat protein